MQQGAAPSVEAAIPPEPDASPQTASSAAHELVAGEEEQAAAAAVTAAMAGITSVGPPPPVPTLMMLDHPFQFFIYDKDEELMLFEGRVGAPEVPEDSPDVALLDAKHSDQEFWMNTFGVVEPNKAPEHVGTTGSTPPAIEETVPPDQTSTTSPPTEPAETSTTTEPTEAAASSTTTTTPTEASSITTTTPTDPSSSGAKPGTPALTIAFLVYALAFAL